MTDIVQLSKEEIKFAMKEADSMISLLPILSAITPQKHKKVDIIYNEEFSNFQKSNLSQQNSDLRKLNIANRKKTPYYNYTSEETELKKNAKSSFPIFKSLESAYQKTISLFNNNNKSLSEKTISSQIHFKKTEKGSFFSQRSSSDSPNKKIQPSHNILEKKSITKGQQDWIFKTPQKFLEKKIADSCQTSSQFVKSKQNFADNQQVNYELLKTPFKTAQSKDMYLDQSHMKKPWKSRIAKQEGGIARPLTPIKLFDTHQKRYWEFQVFNDKDLGFTDQQMQNQLNEMECDEDQVSTSTCLDQ